MTLLTHKFTNKSQTLYLVVYRRHLMPSMHLALVWVRRCSLEGLKRSRSTPTQWCSVDHQSASCGGPRQGVEVLYTQEK